MTIQSRVPAEEYFAIPALSISRLKELRRSPLHYRHLIEHPKESKPLTLGTAAHCATLEPERFTRDFVVWDRKTESGRSAPRSGKAYDAFAAEAGERTILTAAEYEDAVGIAGAVRSDPVAAKYLETGDPEVTLQWEIGDRRCRGRVDWLTNRDGETFLIGLKTARDCRHFAFGAAAARYLTIEDEVAFKMPQPDRGDTLFFTLADGSLTRNDPDQGRLDLRAVDETEVDEDTGEIIGRGA